ncbi:TauD/TfdA family dioxygenase [Variovorax sp. GB1P17]|uniref:TauD/TfdA family dioxygenase n=1 Tax=Variovorax sp. GB1P17 TaxID=3443740 RepID=UPI003F4824AA
MTEILSHQSQSFAWKADSFKGAGDYTVKLNERHRSELLAAVGALPDLKAPEFSTAAQFAMPTLTPLLRRAYEDIRAGRGFVVLRGLPIEQVDVQQFIAAMWGVGTHFGDSLSQNTSGDRIGHVIDASAEDATPRMYRSNLELRPHNDITAMISLACWHRSQTGGASVIVSAVTVHDEMARLHPSMLAPLYRGFHYHQVGEEAPGEPPVTRHRVPLFAVRNGQLSSRYLRSNLVAGHRALDMPLSDEEIGALNGFDAIATAPENRLAFFLERGDMIVINNYTVMHARTSFTNFPEPERKRHLVRLWLDTPGFRDVPPEYFFHEANGVPRREGKSATLNFRKLYAEDPVASGGVADLKVTDEMAARNGWR